MELYDILSLCSHVFKVHLCSHTYQHFTPLWSWVILRCIYNTFYFSTFPSLDIGLFPSFGYCEQCSVDMGIQICSVAAGIYLQVELLDHRVILGLIFFFLRSKATGSHMRPHGWGLKTLLVPEWDQGQGQFALFPVWPHCSMSANGTKEWGTLHLLVSKGSEVGFIFSSGCGLDCNYQLVTSCWLSVHWALT